MAEKKECHRSQREMSQNKMRYILKAIEESKDRQDWNLDQWIKFGQMDFNVVTLPLHGLTSNGQFAPYGGKLGVFRDDTMTPVSDKAVSENFSTLPYYETFKAPYAEMTSAGYKAFYSRGAYNGSCGRIMFRNPDQSKINDRGLPVEQIVSVESFFDSSGMTRLTCFTLEWVCVNGACRKLINGNGATKRTGNFKNRVISLASQANAVWESVVWEYQIKTQAEAIQLSLTDLHKISEKLYPVTSLNNDGAPNKRAESRRQTLESAVISQANLGNRPPTIADLYNGATYLNTYINGRDHSEDSQYDRVTGDDTLVTLTSQFMQAMVTGTQIETLIEKI